MCSVRFDQSLLDVLGCSVQIRPPTRASSQSARCIKPGEILAQPDRVEHRESHAPGGLCSEQARHHHLERAQALQPGRRDRVE